MNSVYSELAAKIEIRAHIPNFADCLTESELANIWQSICEEGKKDIVFYDGEIATCDDFVQFMQDDTNYVYVAYEGGELLALVWLNNFMGRCAMIHFTMFYNSKGREQDIATYLLNFLLFSRDRGDFCLEALFGLTPRVYRHALRFIEKLGFRLVTEMPSSVFFQKKEKKCLKSAVFSIMRREYLN
ncbi:GNAT family N-acetyltransferase [Halodesulfovibrio sp.]|uniref:GNAT family N-acetyltransferase n=1 Tax=Halodesulfovibrio sp. TaxID=1912772 RepID=UPI0025C57DF6|nr:GNAT family N-acetyltransferase [Halodesulfovibrio sp.]